MTRRRTGSIPVSEKHGVNPTLGICFWCGEEDGTIGLLGRLPNDAEAPRKACLGYDPCPACKARWEEGVALLEVTTSANTDNQPPISKRLYPTGRLLVLKREAISRIFDEAAARNALSVGAAFIDPAVFERLSARTEGARPWPRKGDDDAPSSA